MNKRGSYHPFPPLASKNIQMISDLTRDVTVCLEILNQKQIHKIKRKKNMKNIKRTTSND